MAVSNVNMISSYFSYGPKNVAINQVFETLIKFMVSGFDPLNIDSLTVTDGVARVVTTEKNFNSLPGCKMVITGTGVSSLDTRQEIEEVFSDGFTFLTDASNGAYTNGVQYYTPGLGWSLIKSTELQLILKSGSSAITPFYLIFNLLKTNSYCITSHIAFDLDVNNNPINYYPVTTTQIYKLLPFTNMAPTMHRATFFYGDDAFVIIGCRVINAPTDDDINYFRYGSYVGFGESVSNENNIPLVVNFGIPKTFDFIYLTQTTYSYGQDAFSEVISGYNYTPNTSNVDYFFQNAHYKINNTLRTFLVKAKAPSNSLINWSGRVANSASFYTYSIRKLEYQRLNIVDENYNTVGFMPGVYYINRLSENVYLKPFTSVKLNIKNKLRKCFFLKGGISNYSYNGNGSNSIIGFSISILDLTGPIR